MFRLVLVPYDSTVLLWIQVDLVNPFGCGLVWIGLDWFGLVWTGVDWFGLVWVGEPVLELKMIFASYSGESFISSLKEF